ncbi:MAG: helix-turn-helix domain-containing protein [Fretibacterium sp.]|nr:helix-turn-helix domain-containing protein [Fretibacterium sp.]
MVLETLLNSLKNHLFTDSEAKAYVALLQNGPCTGYEVSRLSGVPRSKIYNVLEILLNRGFLLVAQESKTTLYEALPPQDLVALLRGRNQAALDKLEASLLGFENAVPGQQIWRIRGYDAMMASCIRMVEEARERVFVQVWAEELRHGLDDVLLRKEKDLENVLTVLYDLEHKYEARLATIYRHGFEEIKLREMGGRWLTVAVDDREMLHASIRGNGTTEGVLSRNGALVFFASEYVLHDAYCLKLIDALGEDERRRFGPEMEAVRRVFHPLGEGGRQGKDSHVAGGRGPE